MFDDNHKKGINNIKLFQKFTCGIILNNSDFHKNTGNIHDIVMHHVILAMESCTYVTSSTTAKMPSTIPIVLILP